MRIKKMVVFCFIFLLVVGCGQTQTGNKEVVLMVEEIPDSKTDYYEIFYVGKREVARQRFTFSNPDGFKPRLVSMTGKIPDGQVNSYFPNGQLMSEMTYQNNQKHGVSKAFYSSGALKGEAHYKEGNLEGAMKEFYESGALKKEIFLEGLSKGFYENGSLKYEIDTKHELFNLYDENGQLYPQEKVLDGNFMKNFFE